MGSFIKYQKIPPGTLIEFSHSYWLESYNIDYQKLATVIDHAYPTIIQILHGTKIHILTASLLEPDITGFTELFTVIRTPRPKIQWDYF